MGSSSVDFFFQVRTKETILGPAQLSHPEVKMSRINDLTCI